MKKYEYLFADTLNRQAANDLGYKGWELLFIHPHTGAFVFKRERIESASEIAPSGSGGGVFGKPSLDDIPTTSQIRAANAARMSLYWYEPDTAGNVYPEFRSAYKIEFTFLPFTKYHDAIGQIETAHPGKYVFHAAPGNSVDARP